MDEPSSSPLPVHLNVGSEEEKRRFLRAIHPSFLDNVDPWLSGLLDHMIGNGVLTTGDRESLDGRDVVTDRDLRRKVWFCLERLTVEELVREVFPKLYQDFPHIIPETFLTQRPLGIPPTATEEEEEKEELKEEEEKDEEAYGKGCFRHKVLPCIRMLFLVDKMYQYDIIGLERYRQLFKDGSAKTLNGEKLLRECLASRSHHQLPSMLRDVLELHRIPVPANWAWLVRAGFPCTGCQKSSASLDSTPPVRKKVSSWLEKLPLLRNLSRSGSTRSTGSTGLCSIGSGDLPCLPKPAAAASNSLFFATAANEACPLPVGLPEKHVVLELDRGVGEIGARSGAVRKESPHISVIDGCPSPPARAAAFRSDSVVLPTPASTPPAAAQRVDTGRGQGEVSSENGRIHLEGSTEELTGAQSHRHPIFGVPMCLFSEIRKLMARHCLCIMPVICLVTVSVVILAMTGFNIFQLSHGSFESNENLLTEIKQQHESLMKNITSMLGQHTNQQDERLMKYIIPMLEQCMKLSCCNGTGDLVKPSES